VIFSLCYEETPKAEIICEFPLEKNVNAKQWKNHNTIDQAV
jgi:hypothetical protein